MEAAGQVVKRFHGSVAEGDVMASGEVAGEFLGAEGDDDRSGGVGDQGHAGFDEDVRPCLEPPCAIDLRACGGDVLVGGEEGNDGLDLLECLVEDLTDVRAGAAAGLDELAPFARLEPDGTEPAEQRVVGLGVVAVDDHDGVAVVGECGGLVGCAGAGAWGTSNELLGHVTASRNHEPPVRRCRDKAALCDTGAHLRDELIDGLVGRGDVDLFNIRPGEDPAIHEDVISLAARCGDVFLDPVRVLV